MKRFVLLSDPGKPTKSSNAVGRPIVSCTTPYAPLKFKLRSDLHDAVAFLPVDCAKLPIRSPAQRTHPVWHGSRRGRVEGFVVGLLLLDLPSLEVEWDRARFLERAASP